MSLATTVELFEQRARAVRPDADLPSAEVTHLCRRLDGLPLAVELAAARVRVMSVADVCRRLDDRFALLRGGASRVPSRQHRCAACPSSGGSALRAGWRLPYRPRTGSFTPRPPCP
ncbi:hypothetical protein [Nocardiopsis rhodophaea]|uniref:hypothetical protein n=1 Tax=Nocardiopsis rhodophaea TaxID=280238 RepID=UPI0031D72F0C